MALALACDWDTHTVSTRLATDGGGQAAVAPLQVASLRTPGRLPRGPCWLGASGPAPPPAPCPALGGSPDSPEQDEQGEAESVGAEVVQGTLAQRREPEGHQLGDHLPGG